jgi:hypothetical protein
MGREVTAMARWVLRSDGSFVQPGYPNPVDQAGSGKVPYNTQASGNRKAGAPPPKGGSRVPARQTKGKNV